MTQGKRYFRECERNDAVKMFVTVVIHFRSGMSRSCHKVSVFSFSKGKQKQRKKIDNIWKHNWMLWPFFAGVWITNWAHEMKLKLIHSRSSRSARPRKATVEFENWHEQSLRVLHVCYSPYTSKSLAFPVDCDREQSPAISPKSSSRK